MMVPRSYLAQKQTSGDDARMDEKSFVTVTGWNMSRKRSVASVEVTKVPETRQIEAAAEQRKGQDDSPVVLQRTVTEPVNVPSRPVGIPPRGVARARPLTNSARARSGYRLGSSQPGDSRHNPRAVPASVAALLAVTSIPPPNPNASQHRRTSGFRPFQKTSIDELIQGWREEEMLSLSISPNTNSHMEILLDRGDDTDNEGGSEASPSFIEGSDVEMRSGLTSRSISSVSMDSMPDLFIEEPSVASWESLLTPSVKHRKPTTEKIDSFTEACPLDHPLIAPPEADTPPALTDDESGFKSLPPTPKVRPTIQRSKLSFKSNLTASINALASSLKSFSNFTAPSIPPDDLLSRSILSTSHRPQYTSEMRPKSSDGVPDAALRRYLNPTPQPERERQQHQRRLSLDERDRESLVDSSYPLDSDTAGAAFAAAVNSSGPGKSTLDTPGPMIQMQTYGVRTRTQVGRNKRLPSLHLPGRNGNWDDAEESNSPETGGSSVRQREPRENSDFLRVIVLEMNMRRNGKLDAKGASRARVWLPPRKSSPPPSSSNGEDAQGLSLIDGRKVPVRWVGIPV